MSNQVPGKKSKRKLWKWIRVLLIILIILIIPLVLRIFLIESFSICSEEMEKTLLKGDYLLVNKLFLEPVKKNDIIVFHHPMDRTFVPSDKKKYGISRCVALPGDSFVIKGNSYYVNSQLIAQHPAVSSINHLPLDIIFQNVNQPPNDSDYMAIVPPHCYWVLSDNLSKSIDSRFIGFIPHTHLVGKVCYIWFSIQPDHEIDSQINFLQRIKQKIRWNRSFSKPK